MTALFSRSRGEMNFINSFKQPFIWYNNPSDDDDLNNLVEIMRVDESGLNMSGNFTGNQFYGEMWYHNHTGTELNFAVEDTFYPMFFTETDILNGFSYVGGFMESSNLTTQV